MAVAAARKAGVRVDENTARRQQNIVVKNLEDWRERMLRGTAPPGAIDTAGYILLGLGAENRQPDTATEATAYYLAGRQLPDGRWPIITHRPPIEASDFTVTATSIRGIRLYAPKTGRARYDSAVERAAAWLRQARPNRIEERAFQLLGLAWAGDRKEMLQSAVSALLAEQQPDGGWAQLPGMPSDAYATGEVLVALQEAGGVSSKHDSVARGIQFLLRTQLEDGSWHVRTRSVPSQPLFDSGFPHGPDQWISAAATNWATTALALSLK